MGIVERLRWIVRKLRVFRRLKAIETLMATQGNCRGCGGLLLLSHPGAKFRRVEVGIEVWCSNCNAALPRGEKGRPISILARAGKGA